MHSNIKRTINVTHLGNKEREAGGDLWISRIRTAQRSNAVIGSPGESPAAGSHAVARGRADPGRRCAKGVDRKVKTSLARGAFGVIVSRRRMASGLADKLWDGAA